HRRCPFWQDRQLSRKNPTRYFCRSISAYRWLRPSAHRRCCVRNRDGGSISRPGRLEGGRCRLRWMRFRPRAAALVTQSNHQLDPAATDGVTIMGLFDSFKTLVGGVLGEAETQALAGGLSSALAGTQLGSLDGLLDKLRQSGLGPQVQSWLGGGPNQPITA